MCRNIKTLHNFKPPATEHEIRASSLQFVRKLSGFTRRSKANQIAFDAPSTRLQGSTGAARLSRNQCPASLSGGGSGQGPGESDGPVPLIRNPARYLAGSGEGQ